MSLAAAELPLRMSWRENERERCVCVWGGGGGLCVWPTNRAKYRSHISVCVCVCGSGGGRKKKGKKDYEWIGLLTLTCWLVKCKSAPVVALFCVDEGKETEMSWPLQPLELETHHLHFKHTACGPQANLGLINVTGWKGLLRFFLQQWQWPTGFTPHSIYQYCCHESKYYDGTTPLTLRHI